MPAKLFSALRLKHCTRCCLSYVTASVDDVYSGATQMHRYNRLLAKKLITVNDVSKMGGEIVYKVEAKVVSCK